ncbi:HD domain-containing protein [Halanaerobiaceae bacterium Z-7014]|uniref:HD domain-containing protein n=1 Tax=Halonatronomonas betaini TaxID=2778430 RepID=A0A931AWJ0_9FIRM|nr:HD domain-containing protein [Halonatronomonas betaini]MBF8436088.1 HD domain-containing protein [Halonatronomonas betaini]
MGYSKLVIKALEYAAFYHKKEVRKGTKTPYIVHPVEVAMILKESSLEEEIIAAGILHDILEDTGVTTDELRAEFGVEILRLVLGASEELEDREGTEWEERKEHTIGFLKEEADFKVKAIACADKLSNARSMLRDLETEDPEKFWDRFNEVKKEQKWYYESLVESLDELDGMEMYNEFKEVVDRLF